MRRLAAVPRHRIWQILSPILVGLGLMVLSALLAGLAGGACHCVSPVAVFFPYSAIAWGAFDLQTIGSILFILQYPVYALTIARARSPNWQILALLILVGLHVAAVVVALQVYQHS